MDNNQSDEEIFRKTMDLIEEDVKTKSDGPVKNVSTRKKEGTIKKETGLRPWMIVLGIFIACCIFFNNNKSFRNKTFDKIGEMREGINDINTSEENDESLYMVDYGYSSYDYYDEEYDTDRDKYLSYEEKKELYDVLREQYISNIDIEFFFKSENTDKTYFKVNNKNETYIDGANIELIFFDAEGKVIGLSGKLSLYGRTDLLAVDFDKEFDSFQYIITIGDYDLSKRVKNIDWDVKLNYAELKGYSLDYGVKNNTKVSLYGNLIFVLYDDKNEIVDVISDYCYYLKPGETKNDSVYIGSNEITYDHIDIDTSGLIIQEY